MRRTGFTLIELLVVISVIAMIIGILVPVLSTARQQAKVVVCGSNLKQLSLALIIYEQENETFPHGFDDLTHGMGPPPSSYTGDAACDKQGWWWFQSSANSQGENFGKGSIVCCPSKRINDPELKKNVLCGNYGVNRSICKDSPGPTGIIGSEFVGTPLGLNQIRRPAQTLLIVDSGYSIISWRGAANAPGPFFDNPMREGAFYVPGLWINKERNLLPECERDAIDGRHPNKTVNVAFADGCISRVKADALFVEETDGGYSNCSPLWLPK